MYAIVGTDIGCEAHGSTEVEVVTVCIVCPDAHSPRVPHHVKRTVEVVTVHEPAVLIVTEHIHEVLVAHVEQVVIIVDGVVISIHHIIDNLIHLIQEVEVDFVHIFKLAVREAQLMSHTVGQEARFATDIAQTHCCETLCADSCQGYKH